MPVDDRQAGIERSDGRGGGLLGNDVQRCEEIARSADASFGENDEEIRWRQAFRVLSSVLSRQWVSGDLLVLVAYELRDHFPDEVVREYVEHAGLNRSKIAQNFMG
jgi:hypothetical protein